ncbi:response regulator [Rhodobacter sphaeroides]|jgi:Response regulators consisting of a CheY-like receiver domain and a winged-helix DNA-binding domain|uniref:Two-component transcriptional regulator, winged helix family n=3 Tax=Cereibacter TaxID=1653176 RepID=Q3IX81_CERS4|nr:MULTISPECIES: response regulator transcription factor [Cereibacter]ABN79055.1 two component transcriptional regulator, winged helix family [Cereibacter sphaeroides ATCC 17029]RDS97123.1 DNA-binding response regulator [Cereibacter sphaeroides f. sp. denitrificans]ABA80853.1 Two-component transcriptional regulator, winged helix family [Cereibacter sphaeroides 2.4.1]AMJ49721.1 XRE family transcriptional regulator [Cereibacter sphaeroides]ANS36435.1 DNA-binding response regulator [Cereibacter s
MKILLAEDDRQTADYLRQGLLAEGYSVDHVPDGRDALVQATLQPYDLLVVDRMMPGLDGLSLVKALRSAQIKAPILILTAMGGVTDRVEGLQAGADDYLVKPFAFSELSARLAALARRPALAEGARDLLRVGDLTLDTVRRTVSRGGTEIDLQPREFRLLEHLMRAAGRVQTRTMLLEAVWDFHFDPGTSVVETHMSRLRAKIDRPFDKPLLHTVRGAGYMLKA